MLIIPEKNWWETDSYTDVTPIPPAIESLAGEAGVALVPAYSNGSTKAGWGEDTFMVNYLKGSFLAKRTLLQYSRLDQPFAFVMRSLQLVCIDIDGKNGGLSHVNQIGALPVTLAETSKSGNGYHLFYRTSEEWNSEKGFNLIPDSVGFVQGVDIRGTGCVYHHPSQRWNAREIAPLPSWLENKLIARQQRRLASQSSMIKINNLDEMDRLMAHSELLDNLAQPIPHGKRNNTLFAVGSQMMLAGVDNWEKHVSDRAIEVGLDFAEVEKLVSNIERYGANA